VAKRFHEPLRGTGLRPTGGIENRTDAAHFACR
jgi:hypothetical protein